MSTRLSHIGEFQLIRLIQKSVPKSKDIIKGIGDDTAVLNGVGADWLLFTTDMLSEGVHFTKKMKPLDIGYKSLACNISDIAAMGGIPSFALISIGIPANIRVDFIKDIYQGINTIAKRFGVGIVGGDTVKSKRIIINVALLGKVKKKNLVTRCGAKKGDIIFTTGTLGASLKTGKHLAFVPRVKEAQFLVKKVKPSAMIDISDGLVGDLGHILEQSRVGAVIYEDRIPKSPAATLRNALDDGEDFELLFTLSPAKANRLRKIKQRGFKFYEIGEIVDGKNKLQLIDKRGRKVKIEAKGFIHF